MSNTADYKILFFLLISAAVNIALVVSLGVLGMFACNIKNWIYSNSRAVFSGVDSTIKAFLIGSGISYFPIFCVHAGTNGDLHNRNLKYLPTLTAFLVFNIMGITAGCAATKQQENQINFLPVLYFFVPTISGYLGYLFHRLRTWYVAQQPPIITTHTEPTAPSEIPEIIVVPRVPLRIN